MSDMLRELQALAADVEPGRAPWHHDPCGRRVFFGTTDGRTLLLDGTEIKSTEITAITCPCGEPVNLGNVLIYYADWWFRNHKRATDADEQSEWYWQLMAMATGVLFKRDALASRAEAARDSTKPEAR